MDFRKGDSGWTRDFRTGGSILGQIRFFPKNQICYLKATRTKLIQLYLEFKYKNSGGHASEKKKILTAKYPGCDIKNNVDVRWCVCLRIRNML